MQKYVIINKISLLILINFCFYNYYILAQSPKIDDDKLNLKKLGDEILTNSEVNNRLQADKNFKKYLIKTLNKKNSYKIDLSSTPPLYVANSPDNKIRILSWSVKKDENFWEYTSILQFNTKEPRFIELKNFANNINNEDLKCIYYTIIPTYKKSKHYMLLGWRKKNAAINTKILEPLELTDNYDYKLGGPVFTDYGSKVYRLAFYYPKDSNLVLEYQKRKKRIIIEHLSIADDNIYRPDGTYDALKFNNYSWHLFQNVNP